MVDIGQDLAARARFDPKAADRAKPGLGHIRTLRLLSIMCVSAWNKDPVSGVIGVQTGPH